MDNAAATRVAATKALCLRRRRNPVPAVRVLISVYLRGNRLTAFSLARCWRFALDTSCSHRARQIPLERTVFRHAKLNKSFRESFVLVGKLLDTAERLLGDLDPKGPISRPISPGHRPGWIRVCRAPIV
jgi:hypothetical protein